MPLFLLQLSILDDDVAVEVNSDCRACVLDLDLRSFSRLSRRVGVAGDGGVGGPRSLADLEVILLRVLVDQVSCKQGRSGKNHRAKYHELLHRNPPDCCYGFILCENGKCKENKQVCGMTGENTQGRV